MNEALDQAERNFASLHASAGWLFSTLPVQVMTSTATSLGARLLDAARELRDERLLRFADDFAALEQERAGLLRAPPDAEAARGLALRFEQAGCEALALYVEGQAKAAARAAALAEKLPAEDDAAGRQAHLARIGEEVRARLDADPQARKLPAEGLELYELPGFMDPDSCAGLVALIDRDLVPSGILGSHPDPEFRTSRSCNLSRADPLVDIADSRICALLGIDRAFSENVQGQRYAVGQQFKPHHDFFHAGESYYDHVARSGGQRSWTAMLFLNAPERGGSTGFPEGGVEAVPETGKLLVWNNMRPDGSPNFASLHQGSPVEAGTKYVITKWFRERPWS